MRKLTLCRMFSLLLCAVLFLQVSAVSCPAGTDWASDALSYATETGLMQGDESGSLRPTEGATRAELCAMLVRLFGLQQEGDISRFRDADPGAWYASSLRRAYAAGFITGSGSRLSPKARLSRQETFTILARAFRMEGSDTSCLSSFSDASAVSSWAAPYLASLVRAGILKGAEGFLNPRKGVTRAELAQVIYRLTLSVPGWKNLYSGSQSTLSVTLSAQDCTVSDPTVPVSVTLQNRSIQSVSGSLRIFVDGIQWYYSPDVSVQRETTVSIPVSFLFENGSPSQALIEAEFCSGSVKHSVSQTIQLQNHPAGHYKRLAEEEFPYRIDVVPNLNAVLVYALDESGSYSILQNAFVCSTGDKTPTGIYELGTKHRWQTLFGSEASGWAYVYGQYASKIYGNILFHSVPYLSVRTNSLEYEEYNKLGTTASQGCVRLTVQAAKWIYDNCPCGTGIRIYNAKTLPVSMPAAPLIDTSSANRSWDPTDPSSVNPWHAEAS